jgi:nucleotide-binding universal stress UspA family protein
MFKKILVPIDLTEPELTKTGIDEAVALAKSNDADLRLVNVQTMVPVAFIDYVPPNFDVQLRETTEKELADTMKAIDYPQHRISGIVRLGTIYSEVLAEAEQWAADLIVICSHRPTMATYLIGSNAKTIVRHAKCSVLVVRK